MKTNKHFLWLSVMAALLLCTSCSSDDIETSAPAAPAAEGTIIHYVATVGDGDVTRATLNNSKHYEFQTGDVLRITGTNISGDLTLTAGAGSATATFEGDLTYTGSGTPADDLELQAVLVSTANQMTTLTYDAAAYPQTAIVSTLAEAVQKYSHLIGTTTYATRSFSLTQQTAFLNFTVTLSDGTTAGTNLDITIKNYGATVRTGSVTTVDDSGIKAKFVAAMPSYTTMSSANFQLGTKTAVYFGGSTRLDANKIYNISKTFYTGMLTGLFTINTSGDKVSFSQGNLQATYNGSSWTWAFATNQWDYIGNAEGNTKVSVSTPFVSGYSGTSTTVDLFGWSTSANTYGINKSDWNGNYSGDFVDWGNTIGTGWRTLTSDEWTYLFNTRTSGTTVNGTANARYTLATINTDGTGVKGVILFPDGVTMPNYGVGWGTINGSSDWSTKCTSAWWADLEARGCVFLPAAGLRIETSVSCDGISGLYWSSTPCSYQYYASFADFSSGFLDPATEGYRYFGHSVRLVHEVE